MLIFSSADVAKRYIICCVVLAIWTDFLYSTLTLLSIGSTRAVPKTE